MKFTTGAIQDLSNMTQVFETKLKKMQEACVDQGKVKNKSKEKEMLLITSLSQEIENCKIHMGMLSNGIEAYKTHMLYLEASRAETLVNHEHNLSSEVLSGPIGFQETNKNMHMVDAEDMSAQKHLHMKIQHQWNFKIHHIGNVVYRSRNWDMGDHEAYVCM